MLRPFPLVMLLLSVPVSAQVLHLPLDGDAFDASGNGNHAAVVGASFVAGCISGGCVWLDGADDHLTVSSPQLDDLASFTYTAWIRPEAHGDREIFSKKGSNRELRLQGDRLRGCVVASSNACSTSSQAVALSEWSMVAATYAHPGLVRLFLDGVEVGYDGQTASAGSLSSDVPVALHIGLRSSGDRPFAGRIDEVRVWDRALSGAEILALFEGAVPPPAPDPDPDPEPEPNPQCLGRDWPGAAWEAVAPETKCLDPAQVEAAVAFAQAGGGGAGIIVRGGQRVGGWGDPDAPFDSASAAKTGTTALAAILARGDGLFDDGTLARPINPDVPSATVTLRQLVTMTSGISHTSCGSFVAPEGSWAYSNCGMRHAADTIGILVGDLESYLRSRVYDRIGADVSWDHDPPRGDVGLNWGVGDAARLMLLLMRGGEWDGEQILDPDEIARATQVANPGAPFAFPSEYEHNGFEPPEFYGSGVWLNPGPVMPGVPEDLVVGMGAFGCDDEFFMAYSASTEIVVARAGNSLRSGNCNALHYQGNEDFLAMIFAAVQDPPPAAVPGVIGPVGPLLAAVLMASVGIRAAKRQARATR